MAVTLTFYGHATLGLDVNGTKLIVDPFFSGNPQASCTADDIKAVDYLLITHAHGDHLGDVVDLAKRTGATCISNFEIHNWLTAQGLEKVHPQHLGGGFHHPFGYLKMTIAHHGSQLPDGGYGGNPGGFYLVAKTGERVYLAGDTGLFTEMQLIGEDGVDLAVLPIGDNFTMGPDDALKAVKFLRPKVVIPVHYNTWGFIEQDPQAWVERVKKEVGCDARVLPPGESFGI
jgi:L-ascorbate metabolism protein UlaG (beta-lactamase superfamily)